MKDDYTDLVEEIEFSGKETLTLSGLIEFLKIQPENARLPFYDVASYVAVPQDLALVPGMSNAGDMYRRLTRTLNKTLTTANGEQHLMHGDVELHLAPRGGSGPIVINVQKRRNGDIEVIVDKDSF